MNVYKCIYQLVSTGDSVVFVVAETWDDALKKFDEKFGIATLNAILKLQQAIA